MPCFFNLPSCSLVASSPHINRSSLLILSILKSHINLLNTEVMSFLSFFSSKVGSPSYEPFFVLNQLDSDCLSYCSFSFFIFTYNFLSLETIILVHAAIKDGLRASVILASFIIFLLFASLFVYIFQFLFIYFF